MFNIQCCPPESLQLQVSRKVALLRRWRIKLNIGENKEKLIKIHISFHQIIALALLNINGGEVCEQQEAFMIKT